VIISLQSNVKKQQKEDTEENMRTKNTPTNNKRKNKITNYFSPLQNNSTIEQKAKQDKEKKKKPENHLMKPGRVNKYASVTFVNGLSSKIVKGLKERDLEDVKIAHKPVKKLFNLYSNMKDKIPKNNRKDGVYEINCNDCDGTYIGQTIQNLKKRMTDHRKKEIFENICIAKKSGEAVNYKTDT